MPRLELRTPPPAVLIGSASAASGEVSAGGAADESRNVAATRDAAIAIGRGI